MGFIKVKGRGRQRSRDEVTQGQCQGCERVLSRHTSTTGASGRLVRDVMAAESKQYGSPALSPIKGSGYILRGGLGIVPRIVQIGVIPDARFHPGHFEVGGTQNRREARQ